MKLTSTEIRLLRTSRQMKQQEVADKMGIKKQRYSQLENHKDLSPDRAIQILKVLGYTPETATKYLESIPPPANLAQSNKQ
jgi:transcriptional regulator with XRE-family HTH domain